MWRAWIIILCLVPASRQISITEFTVPNAVQVGESVELHCRYELMANETDHGLYVKWWWTPYNATSDQMQQLYQRIVGHDPVTIHSTIQLEYIENDGLLLLNMTPADSGTYECEVSNIDEVRSHQELIVFSMGTGPQLNVSVTPDGPDDDLEEEVLITCEALDVSPYPDINITVNGVLTNSTEVVEGPLQGLYDIVSNATVDKKMADGAEIRCELFYKNVNISHPVFTDIENFDLSGADLSTTEAPENTTAPDVVSETLQNTNGCKEINNSFLVFFGLLLPALLHTFSL